MPKLLKDRPKQITVTAPRELFNPVYYPYVNLIERYEVYYGGASSGKCLGAGTPVVMFSGELKRVEDVKAGELLMGPDSNPRLVLGTTSGEAELFNVHQGSADDYVVNAEHILCLYKRYGIDKRHGRKRRFINDPDFVEIPVKDYLLKSSKWKDAFVGYRTGVEFDSIPVDIDPYFLGVWLGDGTGMHPSITTEDEEIIRFIYDYAKEMSQEVTIVCSKGNAYTFRIRKRYKSESDDGKSASNALMDSMRGYNLIGNKHIPDVYKYNSREIRLQVLAGLIDTDGWKQSNTYPITQKSLRLALDIQYVARSLGFKCSLHEVQKKCINNEVVGTYYTTCISGNIWEIPVRIERKKIAPYVPKRNTMTTEISVQSIGIGKYYGFQTDGDHKFLLGDFTVTHNSYFIADKLVLQLSTRLNRNCVLVRHTLAACTTSCWNQIKQSIYKFNLEHIWQMNESNYSMTCVAPGYIADGNMIVCRGMDDVEKIKSITFPHGNVTDIWYEEASEEMELGNMIVLDQRLRGSGEQKRLIVSFNPIFREHWLRTWIDETLRNTRCIVLRTTYKDNVHLSTDDVRALEQYKDTDPYRYMVYCLGEWGIQGQTIFNANEVNRRKMLLQEKYKDSPLTNVRFQYELDGMRVKRGSIKACKTEQMAGTDDYCLMFKDVNATRPYVTVVDTAGDGSDYYAVQVFDNTTQEQVLAYHSSESVDECVMQMYCIAKYYNNSLLVIEVNFDMYPTKKMLELGYTNLYTREASPDSLGGGYTSNTGYRTHSGNRDMMISNLVEWINKGGCARLNDIGTLSELLTFVRKMRKKNGQNVPGRAEAANGAHDDLVMSLAMYLMTRDQQSDESHEPKKELSGFYFETELEDMVQLGVITKSEKNKYMRDNKRQEVSM